MENMKISYKFNLLAKNLLDSDESKYFSFFMVEN